MAGTVPSSARPTMLVQNHEASRLNRSISLNQLTSTPATTGTITAQRNGALRAHTEQSSSQPTVGSAHRAYTGIQARCPAMMPIGLAGPQISVQALPPCITTTALIITMKANMVRMATPTAMAGATSTALATFDSTVSVSDSGSDFQNSTLRSLRSSYSAPRL